MALNKFPLEIIRAILRQATVVPGALDTSYDSTFEPDMYIEHEKELIVRSFTTKRSLSLVSKTFHALSEEFLYEILLITRWKAVRPLVELLRDQRPDDLPTPRVARGWWTRRLDIYFGKKMAVEESGPDRMPTLWGLLAACSNLAILHYNPPLAPVEQRRGQCVPRPVPWTDGMSSETLRSIASLHGSTLRKLIVGRHVRFQCMQLVKFLACMGALEVIFIRSLGDTGSTSSRKSSEWPQALPLEQRLARVHTCHIPLSLLSLEFCAVSMKSLKHLSLVRFSMHTITENDVPPDFFGLLSESVTSLYSAQYNFGYGHSDPASLVRFLDQLPNLKHLLLRDTGSTSWNSNLPSLRHGNLCTITVYCGPWAVSNWQNRQNTSLVANLDELTQILEGGRLPAMRNLRILGNAKAYSEFLKPRRLRWLKNCGITVDVRDQDDQFC